MLLALTTPQGTRASRAIGDLARAGGDLGQEVIAALEEARLVVREGEGVTLAHEALVTEWGRLAGWVAEARADRVLADEIERDAARWRADETAALWKPRRVEAAEDVVRRGLAPLSADAVAYVRAGRAALRRQKIVAAGATLGFAGLAAVAVALYVHGVGVQKADADHARLEAERHLAALGEAKVRNDELLKKLADAQDKEAMFALQDEVRRATGEGASTRKDKPVAGRLPVAAPTQRPVAAPSARPAAAPQGGPTLQEEFK